MSLLLPFRYFPLSALTAGFLTVLVGYTSSAAVVIEAARAAGTTPAQLASWLLALGVGMGITCIGLSLRYRAPIATAWSTAGAALLATAAPGHELPHLIGAMMFSALLITLSGLTGIFERAMRYIPLGIASAMLAGVLLRFGLNVFASLNTHLALVLPMLLTYLLARRYCGRYAVLVVLGVGALLAGLDGQMALGELELALAEPVWVTPQFSWSALIGLGVPLFVVTMASQNIPGVAVLRANGYRTPVSPLMSWTGFVNLLLAPLGCFALNLAAITAAICMSKDAHPDPAQRYRASVAAGVFYLLLGVFGASVGALFLAFPPVLVHAIAGIALFGTIASALSVAMREDAQREPALITFLVTASGVSMAGLGAAFWGLLAGGLAMWVLRPRKVPG